VSAHAVIAESVHYIALLSTAPYNGHIFLHRQESAMLSILRLFAIMNLKILFCSRLFYETNINWS